MCRVAEKDGVKAIALTPHVFRLSRYNDDLEILRQRSVEFAKAMSGVAIDFHWGAEVSVHPEVVSSVEKFGFTLDATNYVFLEFPADSVPPGSVNLLYNLMVKGYVPIISHPERNRGFAERPELLHELISMGCIGQVTAMSLTGEFGKETKTTASLFLQWNLVHVIASDAHSARLRPPLLSGGVEAARRIAGEAKALAMVTEIPQAILDNRPLPDWGEPVKPGRRKTWPRLFGRSKKKFLANLR
jgi:protein-tyrosine phosphatase